MGTVLLILVAVYITAFLAWPQKRMFRPARFCAGVVVVLVWGTIPYLDPEGRVKRLGFLAAVKYAWKVSA